MVPVDLSFAHPVVRHGELLDQVRCFFVLPVWVCCHLVRLKGVRTEWFGHGKWMPSIRLSRYDITFYSRQLAAWPLTS